MPYRVIAAVIVCTSLLLAQTAAASDHAASCDHTLKNVPARAADAPTGHAFAERIAAMTGADREQAIEAQLMAGNMPNFLRRFLPVRLQGQAQDGKPTDVTVCAAPDYLAVGSDRDFLFVPMRLSTALRIALHFDTLLPTPKIVDAIYDQAELHLAPQPLPASDEMRSTGYYVHHTEIVRAQEAQLGAAPGELIAGDKKDVVITNRLWAFLNRVAIYGWHRGNHDPIQPLSTVHGARYADYSHGIRLIGAEAYVDGKEKPLVSVLSDPDLAPVVTAHGPIPHAALLLARLSVPPPERPADVVSVK